MSSQEQSLADAPAVDSVAAKPLALRPRQGWFVLLGCAALVLGLILVPYSAGYEKESRSLLRHLIFFDGSWGDFFSFNWRWSGMYFDEDGKWQHGLLALPVALVLGWFTRERWREKLGSKLIYPQAKFGWLGVGVLLLGLLVWYVGVRTNERYLGFASIQLVIGGLIWWLLGWNWFKKLGPLWVMLAFLWPMPAFDSGVSFQMRKLSARFATSFLEFCQVGVVQRGTGLFSASDAEQGLAVGDLFQVGVAGPCSGMKSLLVLLMMAVAYGYLFHQALWQRVGLFALAFPLALLGNVVRICLLVFGTIWFGTEFAIGESEENPSMFHIGAGLMVFVVVLNGLVLVSALMSGRLKFWQSKDEVVIVRGGKGSRGQQMGKEQVDGENLAGEKK